MGNKAATVSSPHILPPESFQFRFTGREDAIAKASKCFEEVVMKAKGGGHHVNAVIPVCAGISGSGKARILEGGGAILCETLERLHKSADYVTSIFVPYSSDWAPLSVENSMPIEASFSWRLLYRFFLENNCEKSVKEWFTSRLPRNAGSLELSAAVRVIELKLQEQVKNATVPTSVYLFVGINDFQKIDGIHDLLNCIGTLLCSQRSTTGIVVVPMLAGTDLRFLDSPSISKSSCYVTEQLPMVLLRKDEMLAMVRSNARYTELMDQNLICRDVLFLGGGVPQLVVNYLAEFGGQEVPVCIINISAAFDSIGKRYIESWTNINIKQLVRLAAFGLSGQVVNPTDIFDGEYTWARLQDSSLCLLISCKAGGYKVHVPYILLRSICSTRLPNRTDAEKAFIASVKKLSTEVDSNLFSLKPWQVWETFGACFYAMRINALLVLGYKETTLGNLLPGAMMTDETRRISIKLVPSQVFGGTERFDANTRNIVSERGNMHYQLDWTLGGHIVINPNYDHGADVYFVLKDAVTDELVVFVDQRVRQFAGLHPVRAKELVANLMEG